MAKLDQFSRKKETFQPQVQQQNKPQSEQVVAPIEEIIEPESLIEEDEEAIEVEAPVLTPPEPEVPADDDDDESEEDEEPEEPEESLDESTQESSPAPVPEEANGWHLIGDMIITHPPRNGMPVKLAESTDDEGTLGYWKRTRAFANSTMRWVEQGKWVDFVTGQDIPFQPKFWKERFGV